MPDHIACSQSYYFDAFDIAQHLNGMYKPALFVDGKIDLSNITRHDDARALSEACQKHLHLLNSAVLCFIEDDICIVKRPASHISKRSNLYCAPFGKHAEVLGTEEIIECIIERTQVRIDLILKVARQKPKLLPCFHGRTGQNYP